MRCPDCNEALKFKDKCACGWRASNLPATAKPARHERCDYCREQWRWYRKSEGVDPGNRIIGRSVSGGYICRDCYGKRPEREFNWLDARVERLKDEHHDDTVGVMLRAASGRQSRQDRHELVQWMKDCVRDFGKLPYDKQERAA